MATTRHPVSHISGVGGVDSTSRAHLVDESKWTVSHNISSTNTQVSQVLRKKIVGRVGGVINYPYALQTLVNLPTGTKDRSLVVGLSSRHAFQVNVDTPSLSKFLPFQGSDAEFITVPGMHRRWATVVYNNQLWFTNEFNSLAFTEGTRVRRYATAVPAARYLDSFFDHLVFGWTNYQGEVRPTRIHWGGLYDPSSHTPSVANETDSFDIEEWCRTDLPLVGVTGVRRLGDFLVCYTPSAIVCAVYVGLPKVMRFGAGAPIFTDVGNGLMYGLASHKNMHFFFDVVEQDFYMFDGQAPQSIGTHIISYFRNTVSTNFDLLQMTWAYTRPERYEVGWVFCSTASIGRYDKQVVFNWRTRSWYSASVEDVRCIGGQTSRARTCDELVGTQCDSLVGKVDELSNTSISNSGRLFGSSLGLVLREELLTDDTSTLLAQEAPTLETRDFFDGSLQTVKEQDSMVLDGSYTSGDGIEVSIATRDFFDQPVVYKVVGTWTPSLPNKRLTFAKVQGKIFRYRFRWVSLTAGIQTAYSSDLFSPLFFGAGYDGLPNQTFTLSDGPDATSGMTGDEDLNDLVALIPRMLDPTGLGKRGAVINKDFTSSGIWVQPVTVTRFVVTVVSPGGGGGGTITWPGPTITNFGGGAGKMIRILFVTPAFAPTNTLVITIPPLNENSKTTDNGTSKGFTGFTAAHVTVIDGVTGLSVDVESGAGATPSAIGNAAEASSFNGGSSFVYPAFASPNYVDPNPLGNGVGALAGYGWQLSGLVNPFTTSAPNSGLAYGGGGTGLGRFNPIYTGTDTPITKSTKGHSGLVRISYIA